MHHLDDQALRVHADALIEAGDPLGELIQVELELADPAHSDGVHVDLLVRQAQLLNASNRQLAVERALASRVSFGRLRGIVDTVYVSDPVAERIGELAQALRTRAPHAKCLDFTYVGRDEKVPISPLVEALSGVTTLAYDDWYVRGADELRPIFESPAIARLEELRLDLDFDTDDPETVRQAIARALRDAAPARLRRLSVDGLRLEELLLATGGLPSLEELEIDAEELDASAVARVIAPHPRLGRLHLDSESIGSGLLDVLSAQPERRMRDVRIVSRSFSLDEILRFIESPAAATLEHLMLTGEVSPDVPARRLTTTASDFMLDNIGGEGLARLARSLEAPALETLWLGGRPLAVLDSWWLTQADRLTLKSREPHDAATVSERREARARTLAFDLTTAELERVVAALDLSRVRTLANLYLGDRLLDEGSLALAWRALPSLVEATIPIAPHTVRELATERPPPGLEALRLYGQPSDATVEALAAGPLGAQLRLLKLEHNYLRNDKRDVLLSERAIALLTDGRSFPRLEVFESPLPEERAAFAPRLQARFGDGWIAG